MAQTQPPPPAAKVPAPGAPTVPAAKLDGETILKPGGNYVGRLQKALGSLDGNPLMPSSVRSVLSGYFRFLNPAMTTEHLPRSLKPHPIHPSRAMSSGTKYDILFFYLGNAARLLQHAYAVDHLYAAIPAANSSRKDAAKGLVELAIRVLDEQVKLLEKLAVVGPSDWVVRGLDAEGYYLVTTTEHQDLMRTELAAAQSKEDEKRAKEVPEESDLEDEAGQPFKPD